MYVSLCVRMNNKKAISYTVGYCDCYIHNYYMKNILYQRKTLPMHPPHSSSKKSLRFDFAGDAPKQNFFITEVKSIPLISVCFSPLFFQIWSLKDKLCIYIWEVRSPELCNKVR